MTTSPTTTDSPPRKSRLRRLFKWFVRGIVVLACLLVVLRIVLAVSMPWILDTVAGQFGCRCAYRSCSLSILAGDLEIWDLSLTPEAGGPALVDLEYACVDVAVMKLFTGAVVVRRCEVDGLDVYLRRDANGSAPFLDLVQKMQSGDADTPTDEPEKPDADETPEAIDLTLPVQVDALRLQHLHVHIQDQAPTPPVDARLDVNLRVSRLGNPERPARFSLTVSSPTLLDILRLEGRVSSVGRTLDMTGAFRMEGFHPEPLAPYLKAFGILPQASGVNAAADIVAEARPISESDSGLKGHLEIQGVQAEADDHTFAAVKRIRFQVNAIRPAEKARYRADLGPFTITGVEAEVTRDPTGTWVVAGLGFGAVPPDPSVLPAVSAPVQKTSEPEKMPKDRSEAAAATPRAFLEGKLSALEVKGVELRFLDASTSPPVAVDLRVPGITVQNLSLGGRAPAPVARILGRLEAPGVLKAMELKGEIRSLAAEKNLSLDLRVTGIAPHALEPYLEAAGVEAMMKDGSLACRVDARVKQGQDGGSSLDFAMTGLRFTAAGETMGLDRLAVTGLKTDSASGRLRMDRVDITGGRLRVRRETTGRMRIPGLRLGLPTPSVQQETTSTPTPAAAGPGRPTPSQFTVDLLHVADHQVQFLDEAVSPTTTLAAKDLSLEVRNLALEFGPGAESTPPATVRGHAKLPGIAEALDLTGEVSGAPDGIRWTLKVRGEAISWQGAASYLQAAGLKPEVRAGTFRAGLEGEVQMAEGGIRASASLTDVVYEDGDVVLASLEALHLRNAALGPADVQVDGLEVIRPVVRVDRDATGALGFFGFRCRPATNEPAGSAGTPPGPLPKQPPQPERTPVRSDSPQESTGISVGSVRVTDARIAWRDRTKTPALETTARASVTMGRLVLGKPGPDTTLRIHAVVPGAADALTLSGNLRNLHPRIKTRLTLEGRGLRAGPFAGLFPPSMRPTLAAGTFDAVVEAETGPHPRGGQSLDVRISDLTLAEGGPLNLKLHLSRAGIRVDRLDPAGGIIAVDAVETKGLALDVRRLPDGTIQVPGLALVSKPKAEGPTPKEAPAAPAPTPRPSAKEKGRKDSSSSRQPENLPLITLRSLDIGLERLGFKDLTDSESRPLEVKDIRLRNEKPLALLGEDVGTRPPLSFVLEGAVPPLVERLRVDVQAAPFAGEPGLTLKAKALGVRPGKLLEVLPDLASRMKDGGLEDGCVTAGLEVVLKGRRRHPLDFRFPNGFGAEVHVHDVALRAGESGPILAGVEEVVVDVKRVHPDTGGVHIRTLEIMKPAGAITLAKDGLHVCGLVFKASDPAKAGESVTQARAEPAAKEKESAAPVAPATPPGPEMRLDRFLVTELDFTFTDTTTTPPLVIPLTGLDVNVAGLTSQLTQEGGQVRFSARVEAGMAPGSDPATAKPIFQEAAVSGMLGLHPEPLGRIQAEIAGVDLPAFRAKAAGSGVDLRKGLFDGGTRLRFRRGGVVEVDSTSSFTDLEVSESFGGPLYTALRLPAPLETVLFVLRDEAGAIGLNLDFSLDQGRISTQDLATAAITNMARLIATAIASSPFRIVGGTASLVGLDGEGEAPLKPPVPLAFDAGDTTLSQTSSERLEAVVNELLEDDGLEIRLNHSFGRKDVARIAFRANPPRENCLALVSSLRHRKRHLFDMREKVAARARTAHDARLADDERTANRSLAAIDRELGLIEQSLDRLGDLLRPGSERRADRRTRAACLAVARARLEAARAEVIRRAPETADRIRVSRPRYPKEVESESSEVKVTLNRRRLSGQ